MGVRGYRKNWRKIKGTPDIAFPSKRIAIFINGCFWHRCPECDYQQPKSNKPFWREKFKKNTERDKRTETSLHEQGWATLTIWEHEVKKNINEAINKIISLLNAKKGKTSKAVAKVDPRKCAKRHVIAIIERKGNFYVGSDWCHNPQEKCPRLPGEDYTKCKTICDQDGHAELDAIKNAKGDTKGGIMYLIGHDHCCDPCLAAMKKAGIETVIFNKYPEGFNK